ncbi:EAL domain-containing protein [Cronobacter malonaticus]
MLSVETLKKNKDQWWALPLVLPLLLLPLARVGNTYVHIEGGLVVLYYLPLSLFSAFIMMYGRRALPGIALGVVVYYHRNVGLLDLTVTLLNFFVPTTLSWAGYRIFAPGQHAVSWWHARSGAQRMFWLVFFNATVFMLFYQIAAFLGLYERPTSLTGENPFTVLTLISYQAVLVGCLTGTPVFYLLIRVLRHPRYLKSFLSQARAQRDKKVSKVEVAVWLGIILFLLGCLMQPTGDSSSLFSTTYTLSLLLPVMLWGAMRFGYFFITTVWTPVLALLCHYYYLYFPSVPGYETQMVINTSSYGVFSLVIVFMALTATRQRIMHLRGRRLALIDPLSHMPNLRALNRDLGKAPWSVLCFMRIPELELLGRNYGVMLRILYKQQMAAWLRQILLPDELAYQLSGHDLVLRIHTESYLERIDALDKRVRQFRFMWDGMPLQPQVGISYSFVRSPVTHLHLLLGEMSTMADLSLATNQPESLQCRGANHVQKAVKLKVDMLNRLQQALDNHHFRLMAQRIEGMRGDSYYEILLRMRGDDGELIAPEIFLPVAHEFGLSSRIDLMVLESTLQFMDEWREQLPASRFSINLTPATVCRVPFPGEVQRLLARYHVEPWQLIFEITESQSFTNVEQTQVTLSRLRAMGCRIAIDDFGTGYASYARLKSINADILKIDGSFIRNIVTSSLDYQIVESMCHLARMKNMQVVAEYVESEEIKNVACSLGLDYLQGYVIGKPQPLESLIATKPETTAQA